MVVEQLAGLGIHHVEFLPVASASGDGISRIFPVMRKVNALQCYGTIG